MNLNMPDHDPRSFTTISKVKILISWEGKFLKMSRDQRSWWKYLIWQAIIRSSNYKFHRVLTSKRIGAWDLKDLLPIKNN